MRTRDPPDARLVNDSLTPGKQLPGIRPSNLPLILERDHHEMRREVPVGPTGVLVLEELGRSLL